MEFMMKYEIKKNDNFCRIFNVMSEEIGWKIEFYRNVQNKKKVK